jgi:UDP-N-acetylmuramoyl-L-alanyl-D-glutamate--2,6-diaminopimelate ligase
VPQDERARVIIEPDRAAAISQAVALATPGDVIVVAGKGHETGQYIAGAVLPFEDRQVTAAALAQREHDQREHDQRERDQRGQDQLGPGPLGPDRLGPGPLGPDQLGPGPLEPGRLGPGPLTSELDPWAVNR